MLRQTKAGEIGALRALCSDLISDRDPTISTCARSIDLPGGTCATQFDQPPERRPSPGWGGHAPPTSISRTPQGPFQSSIAPTRCRTSPTPCKSARLCQAGGKFQGVISQLRFLWQRPNPCAKMLFRSVNKLTPALLAQRVNESTSKKTKPRQMTGACRMRASLPEHSMCL